MEQKIRIVGPTGMGTTFQDEDLLWIFDGKNEFNINAGEVFDAIAFFLATRKEMEEDND